ncbi:PPOX class F420-dependent oxidoreductase [Sphaerisporangium fuscum]|uniref:PPOX class F420-dependent oxidoreductase n=1 Tax=Sphaerisporangium fuscum TaxID=2835868 RepID=UPI001BDCEC9B|nr:PPOX class F420-dependent oxidoreductase [Sphaerisporangium fuscum]
MERMGDSEWREFVLEGTRTAKIGVARGDGRPHVTPVWFTLDGDDLVFTTSGTGQKSKSLRRDPRLAACVDEERPPYSFVMIDGTATLSDDLDELVKWATVLGGRYMGPDRAEEFGRRNGVPGEIVVRVRITKVIAMRAIAE